jgi:hypothetical protein
MPITLLGKSSLAVRIGVAGKKNRTLLLACGVQGEPKEKCWMLPPAVAKILYFPLNTVPIQG